MPEIEQPTTGTISAAQTFAKAYLSASNDFVQRITAIKDSSKIALCLFKIYHEREPFLRMDASYINYLGISVDDPTKISYITQERVDRASDEGNFQRIWEDSNYRFHSKAGKIARKVLSNIYLHYYAERVEEDGRTVRTRTTTPENALLKRLLAELDTDENRNHMVYTQETLGDVFSEQEYDTFNTLFRLEGFRQGDASEVIFVKGHWIAELYHEKNYAALSGSLGNSCMRYDRTNKFLDIYVKNPSICSLAVILNEEGKVQARAIVWTTNEGNRYYDRIYATSDLIQDRMKAYFLVNNIPSCYGYPAEQLTFRADPKNIDFDKRVLLEFDYYPYMDSLKYISTDRQVISTEESEMGGDDYDILNDTSGSYESYHNNRCECDACGREMDSEDSMEIDYRHDSNYGEVFCDNCGVWSEVYSAYITQDDATYVDCTSTYVLTDDARYCYDGCYYYKDYVVTLVDGQCAYENDEDLCQYVNGGYFILGYDDVFEYEGDYYRMDEVVETKDGVMIPEAYSVTVNGEVWLQSEYDDYQNLSLI